MLTFNFLEKGFGIVIQHILCIIFQEKCISIYNALTDQISFSDCLYFLRYWAIMY